MKTDKLIIAASMLMVLLISCFGDKKGINISELGDTSFVNKNFSGNRINYSKEMGACENITAADIASMYKASEDKVILNDIIKSDRRAPNTNPSCQFFIKTGASDFEWPRGSMSIVPDVKKDDDRIDIAEAAGHAENWEEAWALNKSISKSSEWIEDMGLAAVWKEKRKNLKSNLGATRYMSFL